MTDLNELKLEHYRQRVLQQEDQIATLRAELTQATNQLQAYLDNEASQKKVVADEEQKELHSASD